MTLFSGIFSSGSRIRPPFLGVAQSPQDQGVSCLSLLPLLYSRISLPQRQTDLGLWLHMANFSLHGFISLPASLKPYKNIWELFVFKFYLLIFLIHKVKNNHFFSSFPLQWQFTVSPFSGLRQAIKFAGSPQFGERACPIATQTCRMDPNGIISVAWKQLLGPYSDLLHPNLWGRDPGMCLWTNSLSD